MSVYAVGDIQGCHAELCDLLETLNFGATDALWVLGDLVNRGPESLATLRLLYGLRDQVQIVLGNHDLHLLAIALGGHKVNRGDTFQDVLTAHDRDELFDWLRYAPLLARDPVRRTVMTHAGVPHIWSLEFAQQCAAEVECTLRGADANDFLAQLYGNVPNRWSDALAGMDRLRLITNYFTRMRLIDPNGGLDFSHKGAPNAVPDGYRPWFDYQRSDDETLVFGHWAAIEGETGQAQMIGLDTGCVWGRTLTALDLDTRERISVPARTAKG